MSTPYRQLERKEIHLIQSLYLQRFKDENIPKGGLTELWWRVISDFTATKYAGADVILSSTRDLEYKIMQDDTLSREYIDVLMGLVNSGTNLTEHQKVMLLLTASNEDRMKAAQLTLT